MKKEILLGSLFFLFIFSSLAFVSSVNCTNVNTIYDCNALGMCDADGNGNINQEDINQIQEYALELTDLCGFEGNYEYCDLNCDGSISNLDSILLSTIILDHESCQNVNTIYDCSAYGMCDADGNGVIEMNDYDSIREYILGLSPTCGFEGNINFCDMNCDENINANDAIFLILLLNSINQESCTVMNSLNDCKAYGMCDADGNGIINQEDISTIREFLLGLSPTCGFEGNINFCDINCNGNFGNNDAILLEMLFTLPYCGNAMCEEGEDYNSCSSDCVAPPTPTTTSTSGGGGGSCTYNQNYDWQCSDWGTCVDGIQTRTCKQYNNCANTYGRPETEQSCSVLETTNTETGISEEQTTAPTRGAGITGAAIGKYLGTGRGILSIIALAIALAGIGYFGFSLVKKKK